MMQIEMRQIVKKEPKKSSRELRVEVVSGNNLNEKGDENELD